MSRAQIKVEANEQIIIEGKIYRVAEHPALPGIPYVQRGGRGFVIQLKAPDGERMALKYFKLKYRVPDLVKVAAALRQFADLPGLRAAQRTVFTQATHADLLTRYPALEYGMMMPWLPGTTWYDVITTKNQLSASESLRIAQETSRVLVSLEQRGLAHCDIAGANVMVDRRNTQIELVDIEEMFGPNLPPPVEAPAGQDGYQHKASRQQGQWSAVGDRFSAAILLAEMLGWADPRVRQVSADEHYFSSSEMQDPDSSRYRLLREVLRDDFGAPIAEKFESSWKSRTLIDCPPLAQWYDALAAIQKAETKPTTQLNNSSNAATPLPPVRSGDPVISGRRAIGPATSANSPMNPPTNINNTVGSGLPANAAVDTRMSLAGIKLCRNCGASNAATDAFCKRCGFYIGTGARPRVSVMMPVPGSVAATKAGSGAAQQIEPTRSVAPPQPIPLNRDTSIIAARRMGDPNGGMRRIVPPEKAVEPMIEANAGSWIIVAFIFGTILAIIILLLISKH